MNKYKIEITDLKNDFQLLWNGISSKSEILGLAVDRNPLKDSLLELLYRANEIREELIETGIFVNGVSKIEYELDETDTIEKILKQFDNIIADIDSFTNEIALEKSKSEK